jgi:hypothetical protein
MAVDTPPDRIRDLVERALTAHDALADKGEEIDDEWSYVNDLREAWAERLAAVADERGDEPADPDAVDAIDAAVGEIGLIADPHRAIDWLSTFPQVVLLALGESD